MVAKRNISFRELFKLVASVFRKLLLALGILFFTALVLSFTHIPYWQYYTLGTHKCELSADPDYIVLMGGGGMPGADGLIRAYYAAGAWKRASGAGVIIAIPADTSNPFGSPELQLKNELVMRGVDSTHIVFETSGYSTYTQALAIKDMFTLQALDTLVFRLVTTPEHMYRSVQVFRKAGFSFVGGTPAFEKGISEKSLLRKEDQNRSVLNLRYNMWSYLQYEITVVREYCALAYYKLRGWI